MVYHSVGSCHSRMARSPDIELNSSGCHRTFLFSICLAQSRLRSNLQLHVPSPPSNSHFPVYHLPILFSEMDPLPFTPGPLGWLSPTRQEVWGTHTHLVYGYGLHNFKLYRVTRVSRQASRCSRCRCPRSSSSFRLPRTRFHAIPSRSLARLPAGWAVECTGQVPVESACICRFWRVVVCTYALRVQAGLG
jgi:hypothetical protein